MIVVVVVVVVISVRRYSCVFEAFRLHALSVSTFIVVNAVLVCVLHAMLVSFMHLLYVGVVRALSFGVVSLMFLLCYCVSIPPFLCCARCARVYVFILLVLVCCGGVCMCSFRLFSLWLLYARCSCYLLVCTSCFAMCRVCYIYIQHLSLYIYIYV